MGSNQVGCAIRRPRCPACRASLRVVPARVHVCTSPTPTWALHACLLRDTPWTVTGRHRRTCLQVVCVTVPYGRSRRLLRIFLSRSEVVIMTRIGVQGARPAHAPGCQPDTLPNADPSAHARSIVLASHSSWCLLPSGNHGWTIRHPTIPLAARPSPTPPSPPIRLLLY